jgi:non-specific serine/threonine protein kinase
MPAREGHRAVAAEQTDFFLSYSGRDAETARVLAEALSAAGATVWIDQEQVTSSEVLWTVLDQGLRRARHGIILASPWYTTDWEGWRRAEAGALINSAMKDPESQLYVVRHDMDWETLLSRAPILASRHVFSTRDSGGGLALGVVATQLTAATRQITLPRAPSALQPPSHKIGLIGREGDVDRVSELLTTRRVVTLRGGPGVGKSRLAEELQSRLAGEYPDGAYWVPLAQAATRGEMLSAIAACFDIRDQEADRTAGLLKKALRHLYLVLVLDNVEQLATHAQSLWEVVREARNVKILSTSQRDLGLPDEYPYLVEPLSVTDGQASPAVRLFMRRAERARPGFKPTSAEFDQIAEICRLREGHPYAIVLDAARLGVISVAHLLSEVRGRPEELAEEGADDAGGRPFGQSVASSFRGLDVAAQRLLGRLTIFEGGASYGQVEGLGDGGGAVEPVLRSVYNAGFAVTRPMRVEGQNRYWILEPVRHILKAYPSEEDKAAAHEARLRYAARFAERALRQLGTVNAVDWLVELEAEHPNFRQALRWSLESGQPELGLNLAVSLFQFWNLHGHLGEGRRWLRDCLAAAGDAIPGTLRAKALNRIASFDRLDGDNEAARLQYLEVIALADIDADPWNLSFAENGLGLVELDIGDPADARRHFKSSYDIRKHYRLRGGEAVCLTNLADVAAHIDGDLTAARMLHNQAHNIRLEIGDIPGIPITLLKLAQLDAAEDQQVSAARNLREATVRLREINDGKSFPAACETAASLAASSGDSDAGRRLMGAADAMRSRYGVRRSRWEERDKAILAARLRDAGHHAAVADGASMSAAEALDLAVSVAERIVAGSPGPESGE